MTIQLISDLHLTRDRPDITKRFEEFCRQIDPTTESLFILGDLFEYWIGDDGAQALGLEPVLDELTRVSDKGVSVYVMHGNRDFLIGDTFAARTGCELISDPTIVRWYGRRVLLAHGDAYCTDDIEHQKWRAIYLDKQWQDQQLQHPVPVRIEMANQLRKQSQASSKDKSMEIMDVTDAAITDELEEKQIKWLIHGHTHRPGVHQYQLNSDHTNSDQKSGYRMVLGDWYEQTSHIQVTPEAVTLQPGNKTLPEWT